MTWKFAIAFNDFIVYECFRETSQIWNQIYIQTLFLILEKRITTKKFIK